MHSQDYYRHCHQYPPSEVSSRPLPSLDLELGDVMCRVMVRCKMIGELVRMKYLVSRAGLWKLNMVKKLGSPRGPDSLSNQSKKRRGKSGELTEALIQIEVNAGKRCSRTDIATLPKFVRKLIVLHRGSLPF